MPVLQITIQIVADEDYDGVPATSKSVTSTVDGKRTCITMAISDAVNDADAKQAHRDTLVSLGYDVNGMTEIP